MNKYESVIIIKTNLTKQEKEATDSKVTDYINDMGKITETEHIGLRKLAYEIKKNKEGYYISYQFEIDNSGNNAEECIRKIESFFRTQEEIIKFIVVEL